VTRLFGGVFSLINFCYFAFKYYSIIKLAGFELSIAQVCIGFNLTASLLRSLLIIPPSCYCLPAMAFDIIRNMPWTITFPSTVLLGLYFEELSTAKVFKIAKFLSTITSKVVFVTCTCALFLSYFLYAYELQYYALLPDGRALLGLIPRVVVLLITCFLGFGFMFFSIRVIQLRYKQVPNSRDSAEVRTEQRRRLLLLTATGFFIVAVVVLTCLLVLGYKWSTTPKIQLGLDAARMACENLVDLAQVLIFSPGKKKAKKTEKSLTSKITSVFKSVLGNSQSSAVGVQKVQDEIRLTPDNVTHGEPVSQTEVSVAHHHQGFDIEDGRINAKHRDDVMADSRVTQSSMGLNQDGERPMEKLQIQESNDNIGKVMDEVYVE